MLDTSARFFGCCVIGKKTHVLLLLRSAAAGDVRYVTKKRNAFRWEKPLRPEIRTLTDIDGEKRKEVKVWRRNEE